jgi:hypothetical protein
MPGKGKDYRGAVTDKFVPESCARRYPAKTVKDS